MKIINEIFIFKKRIELKYELSSSKAEKLTLKALRKLMDKNFKDKPCGDREIKELSKRIEKEGFTQYENILGDVDDELYLLKKRLEWKCDMSFEQARDLSNEEIRKLIK